MCAYFTALCTTAALTRGNILHTSIHVVRRSDRRWLLPHCPVRLQVDGSQGSPQCLNYLPQADLHGLHSRYIGLDH